MPSTPIKTGLLSFGLSGSVFHAPFIHAHTGFEFRAVVERSSKKASQVYPEVISYDGVDALMEDLDIELVVVNTPNITHFEFAKQTLESGKHVLVEKPFTVSTDEAKELFALAKRKDLKILPYQNRRYDTDLLSVKQVIDSGVLGDLVEVHFRYDRYKNTIGDKVAKETQTPGSGLLYDLGPHLLDGVISLFGMPLKWRKTLGHFRPGTQVDDYAHIHLEYPNELQVHITVSMLVADAQPAFVLHGTRGSYVKHRTDVQESQLQAGMLPSNAAFGKESNGMEGVLTTISHGQPQKKHVVSPPTSYMNVFEDVYQSIRQQKPYPVSEKEVLKQLEILEAGA